MSKQKIEVSLEDGELLGFEFIQLDEALDVSETESPPVIYDGCTCACHYLNGITHAVPCCGPEFDVYKDVESKPDQETQALDELVAQGQEWGDYDNPPAPRSANVMMHSDDLTGWGAVVPTITNETVVEGLSERDAYWYGKVREAGDKRHLFMDMLIKDAPPPDRCDYLNSLTDIIKGKNAEIDRLEKEIKYQKCELADYLKWLNEDKAELATCRESIGLMWQYILRSPITRPHTFGAWFDRYGEYKTINSEDIDTKVSVPIVEPVEEHHHYISHGNGMCSMCHKPENDEAHNKSAENKEVTE